MAKAFRRRRDGTIAATLHVEEAQLLRSLVGQLLELLADGQARPSPPPNAASAVDQTLAAALDLASPEPPEDPVLHRLLPDAYRDDADAARDFRRYTEHGLRDVKRHNAEVVLASLADLAAPATGRSGSGLVVVLDGDQAQAWLRTLTDLRLALGVRLDVHEGDEDRWEALPDDDPTRYVHQIFGWLGWLQQTLVEARVAQRGWRR